MIATWRKSLRPASFREVPFFVKSASTQIGRRVALHEYPQRDEAFAEDLGQKADAFTVEAIVIGDNYFAARDALIAALRQKGAGKLVHPFYGELRVVLMPPARIAETFDEGGCARFSLDFVVATDEANEPSTRADTQGEVESQADTASEAAAGDFEADYAVDGEADFVVDDAISLAKEALAKIDSVRRSIVQDAAILGDYVAKANSISRRVSDLVRAPAAFAQSMLAMLGGLKSLAMGPVYALASYRGLFSYGLARGAMSSATPSRQRQAANRAAMDALIRRVALAEGARVASRVVYATYDDAVAARDELAALLDREACMDDASESLYQAFTDLRGALIRDLSERAIVAPRVTTTSMPATLPALVVAHRIYGDAAREGDLLSRNPGIVHPGFVPGGAALEILSD